MNAARKRLAIGGAALVAAVVAVVVWFWPRSAGASGMSYSAIQQFVAEFFRGTGIPVWFAMANCELESRFNPRAANPRNEDSLGLMQINWRAHSEACEAMGISRDDLFDPGTNLTYWKQLVLRLASQEGVTEAGEVADWGKVRLRLAGVRRDNFAGATALTILARFVPVAARWKAAV